MAYPNRSYSWQVRADSPSGAASNTVSAVTTPGGNSWSATKGTPLVAPSGVQLPNDRFVSAGHLIGTTAQRPLATDSDFLVSLAGVLFLDSTLSKLILNDGVAWRDVFTGAIV
jgi:hypothetical protein